MKYNIFSLSLEELGEYFTKNYSMPSYRATQVFEWIYKKISSFDEMVNVPKLLRSHLEKDFFLGNLEIMKILHSNDDTKKFLLKCAEDSNVIEAVKMEYHHGTSLCISSQVGCKMACIFCASGKKGFVRNLSAGEMIAQIITIQKSINKRISNIVIMGIGEPLDNFDEVTKFLQIIHNSKGLKIGYRHITLSTCGVAPKIYPLAKLKFPITLAISLHSANEEKRTKLMPINKKYPLSSLIPACKYYIKQTTRRITFEYALIKGINDSLEDAKELCHLLHNVFCHINLISVNDIGLNIVSPKKKMVEQFKNYLESMNMNVTIRRNMGGDIEAACGQLRGDYIKDET